MIERVVHILPEQIASQIAAGEVVERPASALKEMVENSLDAGARSISVEIEGGGARLLQVSDDGCGMGREDAVLSIRRHATSKIRDASDLFAIRTFGFRGEALASIASVSHTTMRTRRAADEHGVELTVSGGAVEHTRACAIAPGTRIEVRDLFFNTPARLKFLKTAATEQGAAAEALQRLALANPKVAFRMAADGRLLFDVPRAASALERMRQLFGARLADKMLEFELADAGGRAWGLAATSQESFATPRLVLTFVNHRPVRDRVLLRAIAQAYQTLLPRGRHPAVALFVELRPEDVDVNVHPMKTEVRFRRAGAVFELVYRALRTRLADQASEVATALPAAAAAGADDVSTAVVPAIAGNAGAGTAVQPAAPTRSISDQRDHLLRLVADAPAAHAMQTPLGLGYGRDAVTAQTSPPLAASRVPRYADLRVIGQIFAGFIALEGEDGLLLIDQHAAHERVTFEKLRGELRSGGIRVQAMLTPATMEFNPARAAQVLASLPELRALGFEVEPFGPATLVVKGAPAVFGAEGGVRLLGEMIESMGEDGFRNHGEAALEDCLKTLACHGSVRAGRTLEQREITELLAELDRTEFKTNCPHGRPVHIEFRRGQIERMFRR